MSFLDDVPQDWKRPELAELRDVAVQAYGRREAVEDLAYSAGLLPGTFPQRDNIRLTWTALIKVMGDQGHLRDLVQTAVADSGTAAFRPRFEEMLGESPAMRPPQQMSTDGTWWMGDDKLPVVAKRLQFERLMDRRTRLLGIELAAAVVEAARSVAKLSLKFGAMPGHGTGFLIGSELLLTNQHNTVHEDYGVLSSAVAQFDYDRAVHAHPLVRKILVGSTVADEADDWAVLRLDAPVGRPALALGSPFDLSVDDLVVIIQHPQGSFKQFALEPRAVRFVDEARVQYVADTQHGSSGSPVFNEQMHVVALHHAEAEITIGSETAWRNEGIHIGRVAAGLRECGIDFRQR